MNTDTLVNVLIGMFLVSIHIFVWFLIADLRKRLSTTFTLLFTAQTVMNIANYLLFWTTVRLNGEKFFWFFYEGIRDFPIVRGTFNFAFYLLKFEQHVCAVLITAHTYLNTSNPLKPKPNWLFPTLVIALNVLSMGLSALIIAISQFSYDYNAALGMFKTFIPKQDFDVAVISRVVFCTIMFGLCTVLNILSIHNIRSIAFKALKKVEVSLIVISTAIFVGQLCSIVITLAFNGLTLAGQVSAAFAIQPFVAIVGDVFSFGPAFGILFASELVRKRALELVLCWRFAKVTPASTMVVLSTMT